MYESMNDIIKDSDDSEDMNQHECMIKSTCKDILCITVLSATGCGLYLLYFLHLVNETVNNNSTGY